jgi:hypothetical protein
MRDRHVYVTAQNPLVALWNRNLTYLLTIQRSPATTWPRRTSGSGWIEVLWIRFSFLSLPAKCKTAERLN